MRQKIEDINPMVQTDYIVEWHVTVKDGDYRTIWGLRISSVVERFTNEGVTETSFDTLDEAREFAEEIMNPENKKWWAARDGVEIDTIRIYKRTLNCVIREPWPSE